MFDNIFETVNSGFAQALYEDYLRDPASVPAEWRELFDRGVRGETPATGNGAGGAMGGGEGADGARGAGETSAAPAAPSAPPAPGVSPIKGPALRLFQNMEASLAIPTATSFRDIDVGVLWDRRSALNNGLRAREIKLSFTHLIGWAIVQAAREFASMVQAVVVQDGTPHRLDPGGINLGLAVDVERKDGSRGLMVPVIKQAQAMTFAEFHAEYERLVAGARTGKLLPDAYQGGTMTLTNPGTIGTVASVPRLMQGQGSIIATGAIREVAGRRVMTITSTYDHRIIQGAESGSFLRVVDGFLNGEKDFYGEIETVMGAGGAPGAAGAAGAGGTAAGPTTSPAPRAPSAPAAPHVPPDSAMLYHVAAAMSLVKSHRTHGYLAARLDPLGTEPIGDPALDPGPLGLTAEIMRRIPAAVVRVYVPGETLLDALAGLRETYCGTIAYEIEHITSHVERVWLRQTIESGEHRVALPAERKRWLLSALTKVEGLETFLHKNYLGHKRFGIEGLEMLVPMLHHAADIAAEQGARRVVMGMAHRGRLNVLTHILGVRYGTLLAEFEGGRKVEETLAPRGGTGDVKYHHGASGKLATESGKTVTAVLLPNPSHLEAVNPVVEGWCRAFQTDRSRQQAEHEASRVLPILMHGDAAFAAQGVVAETLNLSKLEGYGTGGTLHIITNNQVGFTTNPRDARSTDFASDLAKGFDVPIVHVNADDPEACLAAVRLAMSYRARFHGDVVINLVGYRRHGHNEGDEPRYTQPVMYAAIDAHPTARSLYVATLAREGVVTEDEARAEADAHYQNLARTQDELRRDSKRAESGIEPDRISGDGAPDEPPTAVAEHVLRELNDRLLIVPEGFTVNRKLAKQLDKRRELSRDKATIDWAHAEALALASLLVDGVPIRLTGQDTQRGTFSQRHLVLHDAENGRAHAPIQHLPGARAPIELYNSPLSEYAALGFEYGYAVAEPAALVAWEAQFGDFANGAEIIIDQFIIAGLAKWGQTSRLVMLLPHGHEGQGPEHSSARIERYLALAAERNIRVANCSTPAQYFHILRRQGHHDEIRPLVLMTPKSLLRLPQATSSLADLADGQFEHVLDDPAATHDRGQVRRLVFCSGKVFYDLTSPPRRSEARHVAIGRIELLYPFPNDAVSTLIRSYPALREVVWVQEEPSNMGARKWVVPLLGESAPQGVTVRWISRPERSSPAEGYPAAHHAEQERIVQEALA